MKEYKRQYRELDDETKEKIAASQRGRTKSESHRQHISQAMTEYWQTVPHRPSSGETRWLVSSYQGEEVIENNEWEDESKWLHSTSWR